MIQLINAHRLALRKTNTITTVTKRKKKATITWTSNNKGFTEYGIYSTPADPNELDYKTTEAWSISDDGKTVTLVRSFESVKNSSEKWSQKREYEKQ